MEVSGVVVVSGVVGWGVVSSGVVAVGVVETAGVVVESASVGEVPFVLQEAKRTMDNKDTSGRTNFLDCMEPSFLGITIWEKHIVYP